MMQNSYCPAYSTVKLCLRICPLFYFSLVQIFELKFCLTFRKKLYGDFEQNVTCIWFRANFGQ